MEIRLNLNYKDNLPKIEEEEKFKFLQCLLEMIGLEDELLNMDYLDITIDHKIAFAKLLEKNELRVIDIGNVEVYHQNEMLAMWEKPTYKLKRDYSKDANKQLYQEMTYNFYTIFDEDTENSE